MRRISLRPSLSLAGVCLLALCAAATPPAETSIPLRVVVRSPVAAVGSPGSPVSQASLPSDIASVAPIGNLGQRVFFSPPGGVEAIDIASGKVVWQTPDTLVNEGTDSIGRDLIFAKDTQNYLDMIALSVRDGKIIHRIARATPGNVIDGVMYGTYHDAFAAIDASNGRLIWTGYGAGSVPSGATRIVGRLLLQDYVDDGAITLRMLDVFDVRTGRALWSHSSATQPLGYGAGTVYLDATWPPSQMESYVPLALDTVDLASGKTLHSYSYAPDPSRNAQIYLNDPPVLAHVSGGYLYLRVGGTWYRYLADRSPAHPVRLDGVDPRAWFDGKRMLVATANGAAIARSLPDRIEVQPLGKGALRSDIFAREDGMRYAVIGAVLFAFDAAGTPRAAGRISCTNVTSMLFWQGSLAVICSGAHSPTALVFADTLSPRPQSHPRPQAPAPMKHYFRVRSYPIPRNDTTVGLEQWYLNMIAPLPNGGAAFPLIPDGGDQPGAIGFVSATGIVRVVRLGSGPPAVNPGDLAVDASGNTYFSESNRQVVTMLSPSGAATVVAPASPLPVRNPEYRLLLVRSADGSVWFARNDPHPQIGRADGSAIYDVPDSYGRITGLTPATDRAIWFETASSLGRMTLAGAFSKVPLPSELAAWRGYPDRALATGDDGAIWVGAGRLIAHIDKSGKARLYRLPGDTSNADLMVEGCDRALYVYEDIPQIARIGPTGILEEFPLAVEQLDGLALAPSCKIWFTAGSNLPTQQVGTLEFLPRP